jgi:hypothetical protein
MAAAQNFKGGRLSTAKDPGRLSRNQISEYLAHQPSKLRLIRPTAERRKDAKVLRKKSCPNLALLASWRDKYPNPNLQFPKNLRRLRKF